MTTLPCLSIAGTYVVSHVSIEFLIPPVTGCCLPVKGGLPFKPLCVY